ncbi:MAG: flagellar hook-basal body complex protein FliE [Spirochaetaceae bacterium]|jgi:flagellar hook-basal body complex protein FliE|nr:flagellar hook-basal body complex protein FliE [Spirochaetaceae bacterium]
MNLLKPELTFVAQMPLAASNPLHYPSGASLAQAGQGANIADMAKTIGADVAVDASGRGNANFADAMLRAVDAVSARQMNASALAEQALVDPDSVDIQDLTIAQAEASLSLNIAKNVLERLLQDWQKISETRF